MTRKPMYGGSSFSFALAFHVSVFRFLLSTFCPAHACSFETPQVKDLTFAAWIPSRLLHKAYISLLHRLARSNHSWSRRRCPLIA
jgi:hypothetical protein